MEREERNPRFGGLPAADLATVVAVCGVVLLVSLPCLRDFAVRENEREACALLPSLFELANDPAVAEVTDLHGLATGAVTGRVASAPIELRDARPGPERGLRHHGYVFGVRGGRAGERTVFAWPLDHGRTGLRCFAYRPEVGLVQHPNAAGAFSGERGPRETSVDAGWGRVER